MIDRLIVGVALSVVGCNGLFPEPSIPLTLKEKAKPNASCANTPFLSREK